MRRPGNRIVAYSLASLAFAASIWYIASTFQWVAVWRLLLHVDVLSLLVGGGGSLILYWFLRAVRWQFLLRKAGVAIPFLDIYLCTVVTLSLAIFTPLQAGEILKVEFLKKFGNVDRFTGYGTFVVERVLDFVVLMSIGCVSLLTTVDIVRERRYAYLILALFLLGALGGLILVLRLRLPGKAGQFALQVRQSVRDHNTLLGAFLITCISWAAVGVSWQVFLHSGGVDLGFTRSMALMAVVALISILSLIPGGLGISEASTAQILTHYGQTASAAQAGSLVLRSYSLLAIALGAGHLVVWRMLRSSRCQPVVPPLPSVAAKSPV